MGQKPAATRPRPELEPAERSTIGARNSEATTTVAARRGTRTPAGVCIRDRLVPPKVCSPLSGAFTWSPSTALLAQYFSGTKCWWAIGGRT